VLRLAHVREVARTRLTLGRRLGGGPSSGGLVVVGYSPTSGEVTAGDLDLGRAEVGPLAALPRLETLAACSGEPGALRFVLELPLSVKLTGRAGEAFLDQLVTVAVLVAATPARLCVEAVEAALPKGNGTVLSATTGKGALASVRSEGKAVRGSCAVGR
jgi:hypothetical protein